MAEKAVIDAVKARLGETWNGLPVVLPNIGGEAPADGAPFLAVGFPVSNTSRLPVSHRFYREEGGFRIVINGESGAGSDQVMIWAGQLADLFRDRKFGGIETQVPSSPFIDDDNESGNYFSAAVVVPYSYNFSGE